MAYDPIQRAIDIQLSGVLSDRPHNPENLIVRMFDLKYYPQSQRMELIIHRSLEGFTQNDIAALLGCSQPYINRLLGKTRLE